jgi:phage terminase large subunit GpA-like protein
MICPCGGTTNNVPQQRGDQVHFHRCCPHCGREFAEGKAADLLNERFKWDRVGWYQDTLKPLTFLETKTRMYNCCLLRRPTDYIAPIESAQKYLHGLIEADGNMIFNGD